MAQKLTKAELIDALSQNSSVGRRDIHKLINLLFEEIKKGILDAKSVELRGFGTFELKVRKGRKRARNPKTGEEVSVSDHGVAVWRPGRDLKQAAWDIIPDKNRKN